jgi:hypothetical protein
VAHQQQRRKVSDHLYRIETQTGQREAFKSAANDATNCAALYPSASINYTRNYLLLGLADPGVYVWWVVVGGGRGGGGYQLQRVHTMRLKTVSVSSTTTKRLPVSSFVSSAKHDNFCSHDFMITFVHHSDTINKAPILQHKFSIDPTEGQINGGPTENNGGVRLHGNDTPFISNPRHVHMQSFVYWG